MVSREREGKGMRGRKKELDENQEACCGEGDGSLDVAREMKARDIR